MNILAREELFGLIVALTFGVLLSLLGKLGNNEVNLITICFGAFAGSKGLSGLLPGNKP